MRLGFSCHVRSDSANMRRPSTFVSGRITVLGKLVAWFFFFRERDQQGHEYGRRAVVLIIWKDIEYDVAISLAGWVSLRASGSLVFDVAGLGRTGGGAACQREADCGWPAPSNLCSFATHLRENSSAAVAHIFTIS